MLRSPSLTRSSLYTNCVALQVMGTHCEIFQVRLKARIGNCNQRFGSLAQRLAVQISDALIGYHVMHIRAGCNNSSTGLKYRHNPRDTATARGRGQCNDRSEERRGGKEW